MLRVKKNGKDLIEITDEGKVNLLQEGLELEDVLGKKEDKEKKNEKKKEEKADE